MSRILGTQSYLHLLYRHSPSEWDQLTQTESEPISTGPLPRVICIIGKPEILLFRRNPKASLTLDSILFTHNPTWDDCQQLLQVLFTRKNGSESWQRCGDGSRGVDWRPTAQPHLVDEGFPLLRPNWDFE